MYIPASYREDRPDVLLALLRAHPLGTLITHSEQGLCADHIPFEIVAPTDDAPFGTLRAHVARANPLWQKSGDTLVVFQGPSAYVTPSVLEEKAVSGKVVPTWNYSAVHAHGQLRAIEDPVWIMALLERLTDTHEAPLARPWAIHDAPREYLDKLARAIVGIEIPVRRLEGKFKLSQSCKLADRERIAAATGLAMA